MVASRKSIEIAALKDNKSTMALDWEQGALAEGLACYRRQEFFETHEHWERIWVKLAEPEKTFLQALIHISVAFHHMQNGNRTGARRQLARAERKLAPYPPEFCDVQVEALRASISNWLQALRSEENVPTFPFPTIL